MSTAVSAHDLGYRAQFVQKIVYNLTGISGTNSFNFCREAGYGLPAIRE
ncbi:hypothetical protein [Rhizobium leguminosarum]|nr:hypothetical protein [Rhizobium leguminosarum]MBP2444856.1 hypothetical protein [Rhizobium leguminosarum]